MSIQKATVESGPGDPFHGTETPPLTQPTEAAPEPQAPEVPAKFQNADGSLNQAALLESYRQLEQAQGASTTGDPPPVVDTPTVPTANDPAPTTSETPPVSIDAAIHSVADRFGEQYMRDGSLPEDAYAELAQLGISQGLVDGYLAGQAAQANAMAAEVKGAVGGDEQYDLMMQWAERYMSADQLVAFNEQLADAMEKGTTHAKVVVQGLAARWANATGANLAMETTEPALGGVVPYTSDAEFQKAIGDPRYESGDPAYHREVDARLAASMKAGTLR